MWVTLVQTAIAVTPCKALSYKVNEGEDPMAQGKPTTCSVSPKSHCPDSFLPPLFCDPGAQMNSIS